MAYRLMKKLIERGKSTKDELTKKANVYYAAGQLSDDEYNEIMDLINNIGE
jgi:uncharacterized membrane protein